MSCLLSRVANPIHLRQFLVKCVKQAGQPPLFRDFAAPWGSHSLSKTTFGPFCPFSPAGGSRMCQVHRNTQRKIFLQKIPLRQVFPSASVSIHAKTAHSRQKQPWAGAFSLCQFIQPYGNVGVRELELVSKVGFRFVLLRRHAHHNAAHIKASGR